VSLNKSTLAEALRLLDHLEVGVIVIDTERRVRHWNRWMQRHGDFGVAEMEGRLLVECCPEIVDSRLEIAISSALEHRLASLLSPGLNGALFRLYQRPPDIAADKRMRQLIHVVPMNGQPAGCLIQITDVTASSRREDQLRTQSAELRDRNYRDLLTGIGNRKKFDETVHMEFRRAVRGGLSISLLMVDIDHFSRFNDDFGQAEGDVCLRVVAKALEELLRDSGDTVTRYGGEEFAVLLPNTDTAAACHVAERLRAHVEQVGAVNEGQDGRKVTVSIGVGVLRPSPGTDVDTLISAADMALYHAKAEGRNRVALFSLDDGVLTTV
jgi:diguanylate cyclase (GGDEF)-like protein